MALAPRSRLGSYEVTAEIGERGKRVVSGERVDCGVGSLVALHETPLTIGAL